MRRAADAFCTRRSLCNWLLGGLKEQHTQFQAGVKNIPWLFQTKRVKINSVFLDQKTAKES